MPILNRDLSPGTRLTATYKGTSYAAELISEPDGGQRVRLAAGTSHSSLSAAGSAVMNGVACNGWRFWSIEGKAQPAQKRARSGPMKKQRGSRDLTGWSDARLTKLIESIRRDLPALEGDVLQESEELLHRAEAEAGRRRGTDPDVAQ